MNNAYVDFVKTDWSITSIICPIPSPRVTWTLQGEIFYGNTPLVLKCVPPALTIISGCHILIIERSRDTILLLVFNKASSFHEDRITNILDKKFFPVSHDISNYKQGNLLSRKNIQKSHLKWLSKFFMRTWSLVDRAPFFYFATPTMEEYIGVFILNLCIVSGISCSKPTKNNFVVYVAAR